MKKNILSLLLIMCIFSNILASNETNQATATATTASLKPVDPLTKQEVKTAVEAINSADKSIEISSENKDKTLGLPKAENLQVQKAQESVEKKSIDALIDCKLLGSQLGVELSDAREEEHKTGNQANLTEITETILKKLDALTPEQKAVCIPKVRTLNQAYVKSEEVKTQSVGNK